MICPLCASPQIKSFAQAHGRDYHDCAECRLVFLNPGQRLALEDEVAHYRTHRNDASDPRYRAFLSRLAEPLVARLPPGAHGLDYGSGSARPLEIMLGEVGFHMASFDPFFHPAQELLSRRYHFITCTETVEHFHHPGEEFALLDRLLEPGGWLGVMTEVLQPDQEFTGWWYPRDPTHVCFYRRETFDWIALQFGWRVDYPHRNVMLFQKRQAE